MNFICPAPRAVFSLVAVVGRCLEKHQGAIFHLPRQAHFFKARLEFDYYTMTSIYVKFH